jgi:ABC-type proline/glycine betaine transport system ATPase subunit
VIVDYLLIANRELGKTIIMVTHDSSVARAANRILKIEDGSIKASLTPAQVEKDETALSYVDQLRARISDIMEQLVSLDKDFRSAKIDGDEYTSKRQSLKQTKAGLEEELHRMGVVT